MKKEGMRKKERKEMNQRCIRLGDKETTAKLLLPST
jgi:hypothetical protein